jgi:hypothetical protein
MTTQELFSAGRHFLRDPKKILPSWSNREGGVPFLWSKSNGNGFHLPGSQEAGYIPNFCVQAAPALLETANIRGGEGYRDTRTGLKPLPVSVSGYFEQSQERGAGHTDPHGCSSGADTGGEQLPGCVELFAVIACCRS